MDTASGQGDRGWERDDGTTDVFRAMFDTSHVVSFVFDESALGMVFANDAALSFYGYTRDEFMRLRVTDLVDPDHWCRRSFNVPRERSLNDTRSVGNVRDSVTATLRLA